MTLSKEQIEQLFIFTQKKFVHWYDLQVELVDHLANKIEAEMAANKALSFERALGNVYASFGIFGFAKIVSEKQEALRKANNKLLWNAIKAEFWWPNLIRSAAILIIVYTTVFVLGLRAMIILYASLYILDLIINSKTFTVGVHLNPRKLAVQLKKTY